MRKIRRRSPLRPAGSRNSTRRMAGIRVDTAAHADCFVPPYYDSLVAKLIASGRDRAEAITRMQRALDMFIIEGIYTSIPIHQQIMADADFVLGNFDTTYINRLIQQQKAEAATQPAAESGR